MLKAHWSGYEIDSSSLFEKVVAEAGRARVFQMATGGGEPLLHPRILEMMRLARQHGIVPNITTNGNLLNRKMALALKEAGVGQVQISLNGVTEDTNRRLLHQIQDVRSKIRVIRIMHLASFLLRPELGSPRTERCCLAVTCAGPTWGRATS
jgi:MoaA/NifB/PqqE/SkfB family radical SAM enzyme